MLLAFSIAPAGPGVGDSYAEAVAAAVRVVRASGLPHRTDAMFTTIEGEWGECLAVVEACVAAMEPFGDRVSLVMKADIRRGVPADQLTSKVERVEAVLAQSEGHERPAERS